MPNTSVTTYGLPSEIQVGNGSTLADDRAKAQRVQQQVQMRLAQKATLPRQNGAAGHYAASEYGSSSTMKYQNCNPSYSARSQTITTMPAMSRMYNTTARSVGELGPSLRMSTARGGSRLYQHDDMQLGGFQGGTRQQMHVASFNMSRAEPDAISLHSLRQQPAPMNWMVDGSDAGSMVSERDATFNRQYAQNTLNGFTSQSQVMSQRGGTMTLPPMRRSLSGTLSRGGGMEITQTHTFKGPAYRTINRINNRNRMSMGSMSGASTLQHQMSSGSSVYGGGAADSGFIVGGMSGSQGNLMMQRQGTLSRAMSVKSMHSVGKGMDIFDGSLGASMGNLSGINSLDMPTAVMYLRESDPNMQVLGAAYIQHECYNNSEAKDEVRRYKGISELVRLFNCDNQEVQRYATGATRNLIYENMDNKVALIEEGGIAQLIEALKENDDELHKNITGILWNLSSKDNLKEKLARETLPELTERILIPLASSGDSEAISQTPSEADIFYNTSGCLRNLSSVNEKTRQQMRETPGLVNALVNYIKDALENNKAEDKGVENAVCVLRNLSYQLYSEMPPSAMLRLEGPTRAQDTSKAEAIGCFTPQSRKAKNVRTHEHFPITILGAACQSQCLLSSSFTSQRKNQDLTTFTEVARVPKGVEWLWHPQIVGVYHRVLRQCEINSTTREAAAGALQNITAGDKRWASVLSRVALEQERMLPVLLDLLRHNNDLELRSLTGFFRNLSRHAVDKNDFATKSVNNLVTKLPSDGHQKEPSSDVVVNICGILNNLVTASSVAARDITFFDGLQKLLAIKNSHDNSPGKLKAAKAAATVLSNMFQYKKLHKDYKQKGLVRQDFADLTI
ncbi:plakophilin-3a isoform X2 [Myripristis murdjan]|uniref:plakophilin-3a isoform X2 n=1 Tax=Myripristis murdjan TaxID=586833 RepID=UPI0011762C8C|nr:plakophilin-3 isoform X2 [Myripristis murdjan]